TESETEAAETESETEAAETESETEISVQTGDETPLGRYAALLLLALAVLLGSALAVARKKGGRE
ncbi:MAG: hypothetical protein LUI07_07855, partial [Lachnospiraceae bacterium]|nr:hypothetical protein [Lachnospiraceae bacterium]